MSGHGKIFYFFVFLCFIALLFGTVLAIQKSTENRGRAQTAGKTCFVSRNGNGSNPCGSSASFSTGWSELGQINWTLVLPGDTIEIDGGPLACPQLGDEWTGADPTPPCGMVYNTSLTVGANGASGNPITIKLSDDPGHNGTAIFDGNNTNFTYCAENSQVPMTAPPTTSAGTVLNTLVNFNNQSWIVLDGTHWGGFVMRNAITRGIDMGNGDNNIVRFAKMHHNNDPNDQTNSSNGLNLQGHDADNIRIEFVEIYRNGQDAMRLAGDNVTLYGSYIHDTYCNHPDGIQSLVFTNNSGVGTAEQVVENLTIDSNIFFNIDLQSIFLGENVTHQSWNEGARIRNNLFTTNATPATRYYIKTKHENSTDFIIENNTFHYSTEYGIEWCCAPTTPPGLTGAIAPMVVQNNIFMEINQGASALYFDTRAGTTTYQNNCRYLSGGISGGEFTSSGEVTGNPLFINPTRNPATSNYALASNSPCLGRGSSITSLSELLTLGTQSTPSPSPQPSTAGVSNVWTWSASQMNQLSPFTLTVGNPSFISQGSQTIFPAQGGSVTLPFTLETGGTYIVRATINTADTSSDSLYVTIDDQPAEPGTVWDIGTTAGAFETRYVAWRGLASPPPIQNQYKPKLFQLSSGSHQLKVQGREANTKFSYISIAPYGDINEDGEINEIDIKRILTDYGQVGEVVSNLNENSKVNILDHATLIGQP